MDLTKLRPLDFRDRLDDLESQAITVSKRRNDGLVRTAAGVSAGLGMFVGGIALLMLAMNTVVGWPVWLALPIFMLSLFAATQATVVVIGRYLDPPERRLLPAIIEQDALDFLEDNWQRRDRLLSEAEAFNDALKAFRALPERTGEDEIDTGVVANLEERRQRFEADAEKYFTEFRAATEEARQRVAKANEPRRKSGNPLDRSVRDFNQRARMLARLERSLEGLLDSVGSGTTIDLSPYLAAQRFRAELEDERALLIRLGLKPKKLPKLRIDKKFLKA